MNKAPDKSGALFLGLANLFSRHMGVQVLQLGARTCKESDICFSLQL